MEQNFIDWRPAHLVKGRKNCYVAYSVVNPETGKLVVKRIKLNYLHSRKQQSEYAEELIKRINYNLSMGFNPFVTESEDKLVLLSAAISEFLNLKKRDLECQVIKQPTFDDYQQQLQSFASYLGEDRFLFKIKKIDIQKFLDNIYLERRLTAHTRNRYLGCLRIFFNFCIKREYIVENPAADIENARPGTKKRSLIKDNDLKKIFTWLDESGQKNYHLACLLLYCCFIRPAEIVRLRIRDINFKNQTIYIDKSISKNGKSQCVTMPQNVARMILDLEVYKAPADFYIIGKNNFAPSRDNLSERALRDHWLKVRKALKLPDSYQLYSLKDTGITTMLKNLQINEVRDQARHSSIAITNAYTDHRSDTGNEHIKKLYFEP